MAFLANVGQEEDWKAVEEKALKIGAKKMIIEGEKATERMQESACTNSRQICERSLLRSLHSVQYVSLSSNTRKLI